MPQTFPDYTSIRTDSPFKESERIPILEQMDKILESPLFKHSKRYSLVLKYLVDRALQEAPEGVLKERTIGVEVLGRAPDYDTNADPTVRVVASEIRKRLSVYYEKSGGANRVRIELPSGSYTPQFTVRSWPKAPISTDAPPLVVSPTAPARASHKMFWLAGVLLATVTSGLLFVLLQFQSGLDKFWEPVLRTSPSVLLCVGEPRNWNIPPETATHTGAAAPGLSNPVVPLPAGETIGDFMARQPRIALTDTMALLGVTDFLQSKRVGHTVRNADGTSLTDLRQGSAIFVGLSNYWGKELGRDLRYHLRRQGNLTWIEDSTKPTDHSWGTDFAAPFLQTTTEYALITRVADPSTGREFVSAAGISGIGTMAAGEFLVSRSGWETVAKKAPRDWEHKNLQVVVSAKAVNGNPGEPTVLATYFW